MGGREPNYLGKMTCARGAGSVIPRALILLVPRFHCIFPIVVARGPKEDVLAVTILLAVIMDESPTFGTYICC
jgi:hypothetical protein